MSLPRKLKAMTLFNAGSSYVGEIASATLPKLSRKLEAWRAGGMNRPIKVDLGGSDDLDLEWSCGGLMKEVLRQYGMVGVDGVQLRFAGSYQAEDDGSIDAVEVVVRGRHEEIDMGESKVGEDTEFKVKTACAYYKLTINGVVEIEIDILGMKEVVGGVDRMAAHRAAIGVA